MKNDLTITEIAKLFDISPHTIRFYEKEGLLVNVARTEGGIRRYDMDTILELSSILILRDSGVALKEIKELWSNYTEEKYSETLNQSYDMVCQEIQRLQVIKKRLKQSIDFRNSYIHGQMKLIERKDTFLMPLVKYDEHVYDSPRALYAFENEHKNLFQKYDKYTQYLTEIDDQLYLCEKEKKEEEDSVIVFKEGTYINYQFAGLLTKEDITVAKQDIINYTKSKGIEIEEIPIIIVSLTASTAMGDPEKDIIEIFYRLADKKN